MNTRAPFNYIVSVTHSGYVLASFQMVDDAWLFIQHKGRGLTIETAHRPGATVISDVLNSADDLLLWANGIGA